MHQFIAFIIWVNSIKPNRRIFPHGVCFGDDDSFFADCRIPQAEQQVGEAEILFFFFHGIVQVILDDDDLVIGVSEQRIDLEQVLAVGAFQDGKLPYQALGSPVPESAKQVVAADIQQHKIGLFE